MLSSGSIQLFSCLLIKHHAKESALTNSSNWWFMTISLILLKDADGPGKARPYGDKNILQEVVWQWRAHRTWDPHDRSTVQTKGVTHRYMLRVKDKRPFHTSCSTSRMHSPVRHAWTTYGLWCLALGKLQLGCSTGVWPLGFNKGNMAARVKQWMRSQMGIMKVT